MKTVKMFKQPKWLKPELNEPLYYVHLFLIAMIVLGILQLLYGGSMFTLKNILLSVPLLLIGDVIAHTGLQLN